MHVQPRWPALILWGVALCVPVMGEEPSVDSGAIEFFETKVRPLLVANCIDCHGPDEQSGGLRLDGPAWIRKGGDTGPAIQPGKPDDSKLIQGVRYTDQDFQMPPDGKLADASIADLVEWVRTGAPLPPSEEDPSEASLPSEFNLEDRRDFWSYKPVQKVSPPTNSNDEWSRTPIDRFLLQSMTSEGLTPAAPAETLVTLRRLNYDLLGLPPSPEQLEGFRSDHRPDAFERVVDRLLASPHYGERWGRHWLDVVRFSETYGHEFDYDLPNAWRYRDYVIRAFNGDVAYDQIVVEHIAGDRLNGASRAHPITSTNESILGTAFYWFGDATHSPVDVRQTECDRIDNQIDVLTKAFLAQSVACARCHDHKFDAISTRDYYSLAGFFKSMRYEQADIALPGRRASGVSSLPKSENVARTTDFHLDQDFLHIRAAGRGARVNIIVDGFQLIRDPIYGPLTYALDNPTLGWRSIDVRKWRGHRAYIEFLAHAVPNLSMAGPGFVAPETTGDNWFEVEEIFLADSASAPLDQVGKLAPRRIVPLTDFDTPTRNQRAEERDIAPGHRAPAACDGSPGDEYLLIRGNYRTPGEPAPRRFLEVFDGPAPMPITDGNGRLDLARRIVDPANPLTARVMVNRIWKHHFGEGLVRSVDDFGRMGQPPTHPELLDWLASEFVESGWSVKHMHRVMLSTAAYRMSCQSSPAAREKDGRNDLLSHFRSRRLEGEAIRDAILAVSGRLDSRMEGMGILPHLTEHMPAIGRPPQSGPLDGAGRRSVYLNVRRNFLSPFLLAFDYPLPQTTIGRRNVSNVPAQSLALLNDPFVLEQASLWAERAHREGPRETDDRVNWLYLTAFSRPATTSEIAAATEFLVYSEARDALQAWSDLCHALFNAKEFLYIE